MTALSEYSLDLIHDERWGTYAELFCHYCKINFPIASNGDRTTISDMLAAANMHATRAHVRERVW